HYSSMYNTISSIFIILITRLFISTLFPYTTLFRSKLSPCKEIMMTFYVIICHFFHEIKEFLYFQLKTKSLTKKEWENSFVKENCKCLICFCHIFLNIYMI